MQDPNMDTTQSNAAPDPSQGQPDDSGTPIDGCISTVDQFIADPKSITPETLNQLKMDLQDLKTVLDGEETSEPATPSAPSVGGLAGMIGGK